MTIEQIDRMVRGANPVPDPKALETVDLSALRVSQQRSEDMQTQNRVKSDKEPDPPRRGLLIGAAAVVLLLIGALALVQNLGEDPVVDQTPVTTQAPPEATAVEVATSFLEAYGAYDVKQAETYLTDDADLSGLWGGQETWRLAISFMEATGFKVLLDQCQQGEVSPSGTSVGCTFDYHGLRSDEIGLGPFTGNSFDLNVLNGEIVSATMNLEFRSNGFSDQMWEPFAIWMTENNPQEGAIIYADWPSATLEAITEESIPLWEQNTREYVAEVG
jgi:hypothetical protein